jgi:hypothetical protein
MKNVIYYFENKIGQKGRLANVFFWGQQENSLVLTTMGKYNVFFFFLGVLVHPARYYGYYPGWARPLSVR